MATSAKGESGISTPASQPSNQTSPLSTPDLPVTEPPPSSISTSSNGAKGPQNPFAQLVQGAVNGDGPKINISQVPRQISALKRDRPGSPVGRSRSRAGESIEEWEDRTLCAVFRVTLDPSVQQDSPGHHLHYVPGVREEIEEQNEPLRLDTASLDQAILEAASGLKETTPLDYLLGCWKRVTRQFRATKAGGVNDPKFIVMKEARRLCMSYCIFAVSMPDMFGYFMKSPLRSGSYADCVHSREPPITNPLTPHLLVDPEDDRGLCHDFLSEAISRFPDDEMAETALVGAAEDLSRSLAKMSMNDNYKPYVLVRLIIPNEFDRFIHRR